LLDIWRCRWPRPPPEVATELAGAGGGGGWFMYWKFCAMAALGDVVAGCCIASADKLESDCAKTDDTHAAQAMPTVKARRFMSYPSFMGTRR
jgi:hypothetical protein